MCDYLQEMLDADEAADREHDEYLAQSGTSSDQLQELEDSEQFNEFDFDQ